KLNYQEHPIPAALVPAFARQQVPPEAFVAHAAWVKGQKEIVVLMLITMEPELTCSKDEDLYRQFRESRSSHNYNMHHMGKTVNELHAMLKLHEQTLPKKDAPILPDNPTKDVIYHQYGDVGHWKRNCPQYLAELLKNKKLSQGASTPGIFTIELYTFPNNTWVYVTGYGTHICITTHGLRESRKLKLGALSLYGGDGHRAAIEAIGIFHL
nr:hypothetical protein [Tanacetum cinerariifolium]